MTNYIFDLYGTLIDIHTSESKASLWKEVALLFSMNGVPYAETEPSKNLQGTEMDLTSRRLPTKIDLISFEKVVTKRSTCLFRHQRGYSIG